MQFSLRSLFVLVAVVAVGLSVGQWLSEGGLLIALLGLGFVYIGIGLWRKSKTITLFGCGFLIAFAAFFPSLGIKVAWVGRKMVNVRIHIQDDTGASIQNAMVTLSCAKGSSTASTDARGVAALGGEFQTCGSDSFFRKTGGIELFDERLTVTAAGFLDFERDLSEVVGKKSWDLYAPAPPTVVVVLERSDASPTNVEEHR